MDKFINLPIREMQVYFRNVSVDKGLPEQIIEKDFWVCWTLKKLFEIEEIKEFLTFKGGTSLSKVYSLINRFSEDIDISIDRKYLGFEGNNDPSNDAIGNKKRKKLIENLAKECRGFVSAKLLQMLTERFLKALSKEENVWKLVIDPDDKDQQTLLFYYPKGTSSIKSYIKPVVKIEVGARADHWPVSIKEITPYLCESFPKAFEEREVSIKVLGIERTFWEKATILHMYANLPPNKKVPGRQSRHYYDFYCLLQSKFSNSATTNTDLLEKVAKHKKYFFRSASADYDNAKKGTLKIIPAEAVLQTMEKDYTSMGEMFYGDYPSWKEIINSLRAFEKSFNN